MSARNWLIACEAVLRWPFVASVAPEKEIIMTNIISLKKEKAKRRPVTEFYTRAKLETSPAESIAKIRNGEFTGLFVVGIVGKRSLKLVSNV